jgi:hypothetical protein
LKKYGKIVQEKKKYGGKLREKKYGKNIKKKYGEKMYG